MGLGFEWATVCLHQLVDACGLAVRWGEGTAGSPYAALMLFNGEREVEMTLQLAPETLVVTAEVATDRDEPTDAELDALDRIAESWPSGSLAWDRETRTLLARAYLDAPEGRPPAPDDLRRAMDTLHRSAPALAALSIPPFACAPVLDVQQVAQAFRDAGIELVPVGDGVLGQRLPHPTPAIGSFGFALGVDVILRAEGIDYAPGFWIEAELPEGPTWPPGRDGRLLMNEMRDAVECGTVILRDGRALWRATLRRLPDDPRWPRRAVTLGTVVVADLVAAATSGRFDRRPPRPTPG